MLKGAFSWKSSSCGKHTIEMGKQCNVLPALQRDRYHESVYKHVPDCVAQRTLPVAFTRLFQGNFLALKTRATVTVVTTVDLHLSETLEMLPQYMPRSSTFSYIRIGMGRGVRGTEAVMGP